MQIHLKSQLFSLILLAYATHASIYTNPLDVTGKSYDFIVVGAGTAGGVVATRLSENSTVRVLVIEAGVPDAGPDSYLLHVPFFGGGGVGTSFDWNYTVVNQAGLDGRNFPFPRGHVIGGSSAINNEVYFRGPREDFDYFANVSGDPGWSWKNMQYYIYKNEQHVATWNNQSNAGRYNPSVHGHGPLLTSLPANNSELDYIVMNTSQKLGGQYPFNVDLNSGNGLGVGWMQNTVGNSARSDSSTAYLTPAVTTRPNLDVLLETQVTGLVQTASATFRGVLVSQGPTSPTYKLLAMKEVILSAGAVGTPQILQLSGIGSKSFVESLGITSVLDIPDVGQNLQDQPITMFQWSVNGSTLNPFINNSTQIGQALAQYSATGTGTLASSCLINTVGFLRIPQSDPILQTYPDPAVGPNSPHYVIAFLNAFANNAGQAPTTGDWITAAVVLYAPTSRGSINIVSNSAFTYPAIDPAYLSTASDINFYREAVKGMLNFTSAPTWNGFLLQPYPDATNLTSDVAIESYLRRFATTIKHPVGTAIVSTSSSNTGGVVGPDLRVKKATGLRVVDASVIPRAVGGFPQARVYLIAERASDLIKSEYGL